MAEKRKRSVRKIKEKYGDGCFARWGRAGGSPILLSYVRNKPVKGYKVTRVKNGY
jgi:hypothetical protein